MIDVWGDTTSLFHNVLALHYKDRICELMEDYLAQPAARDQLRTQLEAVRDRMAMKKVDVVELFDQGREPELVEVLLEHYYDPLYLHSEKGKAYAARIDASDPTQAAQAVLDLL